MLRRSIDHLVDHVDDWIEEHVHGHPGETGQGGPRDVLAACRDARAELRQATARVLFLRNKLEAEQMERRVRMGRACHAILRAVREDDDATALPLLTWRRELREEIVRAEQELAGLRTQAADAKRQLRRLAEEIRRLELDRRRRRRRRARGSAPRR